MNMKIRNAKRRNALQTLLVWALVMVPVSALLYSTSARVREVENELAVIKADIAAEKTALRVLKAEWAYLNQPQALAARTQKYLPNMRKAPLSAQVASLQQMPMLIAYREQPELLTASNITIAPAATHTSRMLATPIVYNENTLSSMHAAADVKLPAAANWSQKVVSAADGMGDNLSRPATR
jgi:hypothetical protein